MVSCLNSNCRLGSFSLADLNCLPSQSVCPSGWKEWRGNCYGFVPGLQSLAQARQFCEDREVFHFNIVIISSYHHHNHLHNHHYHHFKMASISVENDLVWAILTKYEMLCRVNYFPSHQLRNRNL